MGRTPNYGLPYPEADTLITDSGALVKDLAERIDAALGNPSPARTEYTVPGTLVATFTASGSWTVPDGVEWVYVVVVGSGNQGGYNGGLMSAGGGGGAGGEVRVERVAVTPGATVPVVIGGGDGQASKFGEVTAAGGFPPPPIGANTNAVQIAPGVSPNPYGKGGGGVACFAGGGLPDVAGKGADGIAVNGEYYGGGGGSAGRIGPQYGGTFGDNSGGKGGGGSGSVLDGGARATNGTPGTGGGGGGASGPTPVGQGGSGRVMIYTTAPGVPRYTACDLTPAAVDAALDDAGALVGVYAVDPERPYVPGEEGHRLVPYPAEPQRTGRRYRTVIDKVERIVEETAWPGHGWTYADGVWVPPGGFPKPARPRITAAYPLPDSTIRAEWGVEFGEDLVVDRTEVQVVPAKGDPTGYTIKGDPREYVTGKVSPGVYRVQVRVEILAEWSQWSEAATVTVSTTEPAFVGGREWDGGGGYRWLIFDPADTGIPTTQWEITRTKAGATVEAEVLVVGPGGAGQGQTLTMAKGGNGGGGEMVLGTLPPAAPGSIMVTVGQGGKNADGKDPADSTVVEGSTTIRARAGKSTTTKADGAGFGPVEVPESWRVAPPFRWDLPDSARVGGCRDWDKSERPNGKYEGQGGGGTNTQGPQRGGDGHDGVVVLRWRVS